MPLYDFECRTCGHTMRDQFFRVAEIKDVIEAQCPSCGKATEFELLPSICAVDDWGKDGQGKYFEHISYRGEHFRDRKSFKRFMRKHGLRETNSYVD